VQSSNHLVAVSWFVSNPCYSMPHRLSNSRCHSL
jgi:hypothetical protein